MKKKYDIEGMTCASCQAHIQNSIKKLDGVKDVNVSLVSNSMQVEYDENKTNDAKIIATVERSGYKAFIKNIEKKKVDVKSDLKKRRDSLIASITFSIFLIYISMGHMLGWYLPQFFIGGENALNLAFTQFLLALPVLYLNRSYFINGFKRLFRLSPNMDSLIAIGASASVIYGIYAIFRIGIAMGGGDIAIASTYAMDLYFESAVSILTLVSLGKYLEELSKNKTADAIEKLVKLAPKSALVIEDGKEIEKDIALIKVGDLISVKPGMQIPVDGVVTDGEASIDESAMTGESVLAYKEPNSPVISSTTLKSGSIIIKATKVGDDTTIATIIRLVKEASDSKAPISKLADKISLIFVPAVILISLVSFLIWLFIGSDFAFALNIGITVLVIACPCALGLATPIAIMVGTGKGAENGLLIKNAESLEYAGKIDTIIFDKTNTITKGELEIIKTYNLSEVSDLEMMKIAASIERKSEHPIANAIVKKYAANDYYDVKSFENTEGRGVSAIIDGIKYYLGSVRFYNPKKSDEKLDVILKDAASNAMTSLILFTDEKPLYVINLRDEIKPTSYEAVRKLKSMGLKVMMLTGDNKLMAESIAKMVGIDHVFAEVLPSEKQDAVLKEKANGLRVAMVGDGINDALALKSADLGIAIANGTDIAIDSADIILHRNNLLDVINIIKLSKKVLFTIKMNFFWAFIYNAIGIFLATGILYNALGIKLSPMIGALAMSLSSVSVVLNSLRINLFKSIQKEKEEKIMQEITLHVKGMTCEHCRNHVTKALQSVKGVTFVSVDLKAKTATVKGENLKTSELIEAVAYAGYEASL